MAVTHRGFGQTRVMGPGKKGQIRENSVNHLIFLILLF